jgi:hypothetical protein
MGGSGSGRQATKACMDELPALDIGPLNRGGLLKRGTQFASQWTNAGADISIQVAVRHDGAVIDQHVGACDARRHSIRYTVPIEWRPCRFGGQRPWWHCPVVECGRRVAVLYAGSLLACRHCYALAYRTQRESADGRALTRAEAIRRRLGWQPGIVNGHGPRPKGMHRTTFEALLAKHERFIGEALIHGASHLLDR